MRSGFSFVSFKSPTRSVSRNDKNRSCAWRNDSLNKTVPDYPSNPPTGNDPWVRPELIVPWRRIIEVVAVMLGVGIIFGAFYSTRHASGEFYQRFNDYFLVKNGALECAFLAPFLLFLHRSGWKSSDFRIRIGWWTSLSAIGLFFVTSFGVYLVNRSTLSLASIFHATTFGRWIDLFVPAHFDVAPGSIHLHWATIIGATLLNAFYEELVYMGYVFNQLAAKYGAQKAVLLTAFLRLVVHTYQGTEHLLPIALWSLIFGLWYRYQRKLWPLILAHFLIDLLSLGLFKIMYGASS